MRPPLLFLLFGSIVSKPDDKPDVKQDVKTYVKRVGDLQKHGIDVLEALTKVSESSKQLLKLGGPVAGLVALLIDTTVAPDSDERKAIDMLHSAMTKEFRLMGIETIRLQRELLHQEFSTKYREEVSLKLTNLYNLFASVTDVSGPDPKEKLYFVDRCLKETGPREILTFIETVFVSECPVPKQTRTESFIMASEAFYLLESRVEEKYLEQLSPTYYEDKSIVIQMVKAVPLPKQKKLLTKITNASALDHLDLEQLVNEIASDKDLRRMMVMGPKCALEIIADHNQHINKYILSEVQRLTIDLVKLEIMITACANVSTNGDADKINKWINLAGTKIENIGKNVVKWVLKTQEIDFPKVGISAAKKAIGFDDVPINKFNSTAKDIKKAFEIRGPEQFGYQVVVAKTENPGMWWAYSAVNTNNYVMFSHMNLDVHIFVYEEDGAEERAANAARWFEKKQQPFHDYIYDLVPNKPRADNVLTYLQMDCGPLVMPWNYRSMLLLRNQAYWATNVHIQVGEAFDDEVVEVGASKMTVLNDPWLELADEVKLFFLL